MYNKMDVEILRTIYYFVQEDGRCLRDRHRRSQTIELIAKTLEIKPALVGKIAGQFVSATLDLGFALRGRYLWVKKAKELSPRVAMYRAEKGPIFVVFSSRKVIKRFKRGGPLTDLLCTPNLALPIPEESIRHANWALKEYGFTIQKLLDVVVKEDM